MSGIGVFDSGVGGLTVLKTLTQAYPDVNFYFIGDNQRAPYGSRSIEQLKLFSKELITALVDMDVDLIVTACNTISSLDLKSLEKEAGVPIIGIIEATAQLAHTETSNHQIGLIATEKTIESQCYQRLLKELDENNELTALATPQLVPLVEENKMGTEEALERVKEALAPIKGEAFDTLILGCTHYPFLKDEIKQVLGNQISIVDASMAVSDPIKKYIRPDMQVSDRTIKLFTSGDPLQFEKIATGLLAPLDFEIKKINL
ncbi:MAG: glutamate racemase [Atopococcus tabaci]|uniref:Glutamate racemase n=1 Tax=Atopococcus tabaci TaxID=269774 RepID=A0AA43UB14_9LACT|nr:glutamate racemase [Atopococcus tabaci]